MRDFTGLGVDMSIEDGDWAKHLHGKWQHGQIIRVGNLPDGTSAGKPAFQLLATLDDGTQVIVETTWALMRGALVALNGRWPVDGQP